MHSKTNVVIKQELYLSSFIKDQTTKISNLSEKTIGLKENMKKIYLNLHWWGSLGVFEGGDYIEGDYMG